MFQSEDGVSAEKEGGAPGVLTYATVPRGLLLRHVDAGDAGVPLLHPSAVLFNVILVKAGREDELVVGPDRGVGVADELNHADAALGLGAVGGWEV